MVWHHLQYVDGLIRLGHDVWFVELGDDYPSCYDPRTGTLSGNASYGLSFAAHALSIVSAKERWAYHDNFAGQWLGPAAQKIEKVMSTADVVLNVSGVNPLAHGAESAACRVFIDTDPAFTQIRHLQDSDAKSLAATHTHHFSFGELIGQPGCIVPDDGFTWIPTRQPVVLDRWPVVPLRDNAAFTTVMQWQSYPSRIWKGHHFGMKSDAFEMFIDLPRHTTQPFELAIGGATAPRNLLLAHGWALRNSELVTTTPESYQSYIAASRGEFTVAKAGYVTSRSGWFSERSAAYLASGRPVVTQETGFSSVIGTGPGLVAFNSVEEAVDAVGRVVADSRAVESAREIATAYFAHDLVLTELLSSISRSSS